MNPPKGRRGPFDSSDRLPKRRPASAAARPAAIAAEAQERALIRYLPGSVHVRLGAATRRSARIILEIFGGLAIIGALILALVYGRLNQGPISLKFLVQPVEQAVNSELSGLQFRIGGAVVRKAESGVGLEFRLQNVSLLDQEGLPIAQAPSASIELSVRALLALRFAAASVDLIGPRLYLQYSEQEGLALAFSRRGGGPADPFASTAGEAAARDGASRLPGGRFRPPETGFDRAGARMAGREGAASQGAGRRDDEEAASGPEAQDSRARAISIAAALGGLFDTIRESGPASYLTRFGVVDASVYVGETAGATEWKVRTASLALGHAAAASLIRGEAVILSDTGPLQLSFGAEQKRPARSLSITAAASNVVPRAMAARLPGLDALKVWGMPVDVEGRFDLDADGSITTSSARASLASGQIHAPWDEKHPASIDEAQFNLEYSRQEGVFKILPSAVRWGASHIELQGAMRRIDGDDGARRWAFDVAATDVALAAEEFSLPAIPMDVISLRGSLAYDSGDLTIDRLMVRAADAFVALHGSVEGFNGPLSPAVRLEGTISPMPIAFFKLLWPQTVAYGARRWVGQHVRTGKITGASIHVAFAKGAISTIINENAKIPDDAVSVKAGLSGVSLEYMTGMPPFAISEATATFTGQRFLLDAPDASIALPSGESLRIAAGQFIIGDLKPEFPVSEVHFKAQAKAAAALELLDQEPLGYVSAIGLKPDIASGVVSGSFSIAIPMIEDVKFKQLKLNGKAHYQDVRLNAAMGGYGVHGGAILFDLTEKTLAAQGEVKVNGVPVKLDWQRVFDAPPGRQPPLRAAAVFDEAAREQLGLPINHIVRGPVPVEAAVVMNANGPPTAHFEANLSGAELFISLVGRRKPPGEKAVLSLDVNPRPDGRVDLDNLKLVGDEIAVSGSLSLNEQKRPVAFRLPHCSFNILSRMEVAGVLGDNNVWKVEARGASFDGRDVFRSLFSAGKLSEDQPGAPKDSPGVEMHAEIDTVLGYFDTTLKNVTIDARRRAEKLAYLDIRGRLNGGRPLAARVEHKAGEPRMLLGEAADAGAAFRLIGLYSAMRGGEASLRVNLDGGGGTEKTGSLYVHNFAIVGDHVVGEVLANTPKAVNSRQRGASRRGARPSGDDDDDDDAENPDQIQFDRLKAPFSVGHGQFVLGEAAINGPLLGATLRGRYDFARQYVDLSGTYVPLYGINGAFHELPLFGPLLTGRSGEGMFGITFAIQGPTNRPIQTQINPLSMVAPGFLRQIFEFDSPPAHVLPQERNVLPQERKAPQPDARASSAPPVTR